MPTLGRSSRKDRRYSPERGRRGTGVGVAETHLRVPVKARGRVATASMRCWDSQGTLESSGGAPREEAVLGKQDKNAAILQGK